MIIEDFTPAQRKIIKKICITQLDSLRRLLHNESEDTTDLTMLLIESDVTKEEYENQLLLNITKFSKLGKNPDDLTVLEDTDLSIFRHILSQVECQFQEKYPNAIANLWGRLFLLEDMKKAKKYSLNVN